VTCILFLTVGMFNNAEQKGVPATKRCIVCAACDFKTWLARPAVDTRQFEHGCQVSWQLTFLPRIPDVSAPTLSHPKLF